jgi:hypothetical protein
MQDTWLINIWCDNVTYVTLVTNNIVLYVLDNDMCHWRFVLSNFNKAAWELGGKAVLRPSASALLTKQNKNMPKWGEYFTFIK